MELSGKLTKMAAWIFKNLIRKDKKVTFVFAYVSLPSLEKSQAWFVWLKEQLSAVRLHDGVVLG